MDLKFYLIIYILVINIIAFFAMNFDKQKAINQKRRTSEKTLFTLALLLGGIGIYSGMFKFRHKTKHMKFLILVPFCICLNFITVYYIFTLLH